MRVIGSDTDIDLQHVQRAVYGAISEGQQGCSGKSEGQYEGVGYWRGYDS